MRRALGPLLLAGALLVSGAALAQSAKPAARTPAEQAAERSLELYSRALEAGSGKDDARALALLQQALALLEPFPELAADRAEILHELGRTLAALARPQEAIASYERALAAAERAGAVRPDMLWNIAETSWKLGRRAPAVLLYERALRLSLAQPGPFSAPLALSRAQILAARYDEAGDRERAAEMRALYKR